MTEHSRAHCEPRIAADASRATDRSLPRRLVVRAPGRVNLIGEHTDHSGGLALPFATDLALRVVAERSPRPDPETPSRDACIVVRSRATGERVRVELPLADEPFGPASTGRSPQLDQFVRAAIAELAARGIELPSARLEIDGDLPPGVGLSSSAALCLGLLVALAALVGVSFPDRLDLARLASRVEHRAGGAPGGLLDQLAILTGSPGAASLIDFATNQVEAVPLTLPGARLAILPSGDRRALGASAYRTRVEECARAAQLLGVEHLAHAPLELVAELPEPLRSRARHVVEETARVRDAASALRAGDVERLGELLDASHRSLRDLFEVSTPALERTRAHARDAGAIAARLLGGGFGGVVLALFPATRPLPKEARAVRAADGLAIW